MDIKALGDFICLAEHKHFGAAAHERNITVSGLSRRIKSLEQWVGTSLVNRNETPIELTEAGIEFLKLASEILNHLKGAEEKGKLKFASVLFPSVHATAPIKTLNQNKFTIAQTRPTITIKPFHSLSRESLEIDLCTTLTRALSLHFGESFIFDYVRTERESEYLVDGSVLCNGLEGNITLQIAQAQNGRLVLSRKYGFKFDDFVNKLEEIAADFAWTISYQLRRLIVDSVKRIPPDQRTNVENFLVAHEAIGIPGSGSLIRPALERLRRAEPDAYWFHHIASAHELVSWSMKPSDTVRLTAARKYSEAAESSNPDYYPGIMLSAVSACFDRDFAMADDKLSRVLEIAPNDTMNTIGTGIINLALGKTEAALHLFRKAKKYEPGLLWYSPVYAAQALYQLERYEEAANEIDLRRSPFPDAVAIRLAALAQVGNLDQARVLRTAQQYFTPSSWKRFYLARFPFADSAFTDHLVEGLHKADINIV